MIVIIRNQKRKDSIMNFIFLLIVLAVGGLILFYFSRENNLKRKENLNIIQEKGKVHFYLSDDHFLSIKFDQNSKLGDIISKTIAGEIGFIKDSVRKISFINFRNDSLERELNRILQVRV